MLNAKERTEELKKRGANSKKKLKEEADKQAERERWPIGRKKLYKLITHPLFEAICGLIILFNMVLVVFETDASQQEGPPPFWIQVMTNMLLGVYSMELAVKLYVYRVDFFYEMWNVLDFFIVGVDVVFLFIALIVSKLPSISILRVFRLVRLARAFKAAKSFHELHSLLRACACALKAIFWGMVMMILTLTVWGILAVQLIHPINKEIAVKKPWLYEGCDRCPRAFATVFDSILTIWKQIVAGDSWGTLCEPIIEQETWTFMFFMLVFVTVALTMLNCILAVVVEAGAAAAQADQHDKAVAQEKQVLQAEGKLIDLCQGLDADDSGSLNIEEFLNGFHNNKPFKECLEVMHVTESDMFMIFNICDEDDSGDVDYREFVEQLRRIKHSGEQMLLHYVTDIRHMVTKIGKQTIQSSRQDGSPDKENAEGTQNETEEGNYEIKLDTRSDTFQCTTSPKPSGAVSVNDTLDSRKIGAQNLAVSNLAVSGGFPREEKTDDTIVFLCQEKLERIFKLNENLTSIMSAVSAQSKVQTGMLNTLVGRVPALPSVNAFIGNEKLRHGREIVSCPLTPRIRKPEKGRSVGESDTGGTQPPTLDAAIIREKTVPIPVGACCTRLGE